MKPVMGARATLSGSGTKTGRPVVSGACPGRSRLAIALRGRMKFMVLACRSSYVENAMKMNGKNIHGGGCAPVPAAT